MALVKFLTAPEAGPIINKIGMEPAGIGVPSVKVVTAQFYWDADFRRYTQKNLSKINLKAS